MNIIKYTDSEIAKNFALLEQHLKQAQSGVDEIFCEDCINKHLILLEGLAEEGMNVGDSKKYKKVYDFAKNTRGKNYQKKGVELSKEAREIRKSLTTCSICTLSKDLNNIDDLDNHIHNSDGYINNQPQLNGENKKMAKVSFKDLGMYNVGQFAAEGAKYLIDTKFAAQEPYVSLGGGVGLQVLPMFIKMPSFMQKIFLIAGSNLFAYGVVNLVKGTTTPIVAKAGVAKAGVAKAGNTVGKFTGQPNGRVFGGPVTATNIPSQYARSGILAGAQAFETPEHADLIRVD